MLSQALARLSPPCRRLIEMLFLETLPRTSQRIQGWSRDPLASYGRSASSICVGNSPNQDFDNATW
jgi:hypothetical protein